jgi:hypothetical protein
MLLESTQRNVKMNATSIGQYDFRLEEYRNHWKVFHIDKPILYKSPKMMHGKLPFKIYL